LTQREKIIHAALRAENLPLTEQNLENMRRYLDGGAVIVSGGFGPLATLTVIKKGNDDISFVDEDVQFVNPAKGDQ